MSNWTGISGAITVSPMGRTQAEKRYILDTVLAHLPIVSGSEKDMDVYVIQKNGENSTLSCDEFGDCTNNLVDCYDRKSFRDGLLRTQDEYIIVVDGSFRDRVIEQTFLEFQKWLCRLAKRVKIEDLIVKVRGFNKKIIIDDKNGAYHDMYEWPSWSNECNTINWCEYLLWDKTKDSDWPLMLTYKYFNNKENDAEVARRMKWQGR